MIKLCIVLTLLVAVANSAAKPVCEVNKILAPSDCECKATQGETAVITAANVNAGYWCMLTGSTYAIKTAALSACTTGTKVTTTPCFAGANEPEKNICVNDQYKSANNVCTPWCTIATGTTGCKTCGSTKNTCDKCNAGYYYVSGATCTEAICSKAVWVTGVNQNTAFASCDTGKEYDSDKATTKCGGSACTSDKCCKTSSSSSSGSSATSSSMSLAIQTVLIIGIMNFM